MKTIIGMAAFAIIIGQGAQAKETGIAPERNVIVCIERPNQVLTISAAQALASRMFAGIGVELEWHSSHRCPLSGDVVKISFSFKTPTADHADALAYAYPYEGTHIVVLYDRVKICAREGRPQELLAYVLVHEITHILQGVSRHSESGIMKASWNQTDYYDMSRGTLQFTSADIDLINGGLNKRTAKLSPQDPLLLESRLR